MLDACAQLLGKGVWFTSHINENLAEIATVAGLFPEARHYLGTYRRHGRLEGVWRDCVIVERLLGEAADLDAV